MQWNDGYSENVFSFANNINTAEGGTHLIGFKSALTRTVNSYAIDIGQLKKDDANLQGEDVREGLTAVVSVKVPEPQFEGQTKTKLGNSEVKGIVEALVNEKFSSLFLSEHPADAKQKISKGVEAARVREATRKAKDLARRKGALDSRVIARKARRLSGERSGIERDLSRGGRFRRRFRKAGTRPTEPGDASVQRKDPQRRESAGR